MDKIGAKEIAKLAVAYQQAHKANENNPAMLLSSHHSKEVTDGCVARMDTYFAAEKALFNAIDNITLREIALYRGLISALARVYRYVINRGLDSYYFTRKEIKELLKNENDTARFGDLVWFGGLVFKTKKAHYGMNMERCRDFFRGEHEIPTRVWKNPVTDELVKAEDYRLIGQIPGILEKLDEEGFYVSNYKRKE